MSRRTTIPKAVVLGWLLITGAAAAGAEEWPHWGGPDRNFSVSERGLATSWPPAGPTREWSLPLGPGHAGLVVADGTVYGLYREGDDEVLVAHHAEHGGLKWRQRQPAKLWGKFNEQFGTGPHSTPAVRSDRLYKVSVRGEVQCLETRTGKVVWSYDLWKEHGAEPTDRGYASSPLLLRGMVILPAPGQGLVALDAADGTLLWTRFGLTNGAFSSPIVARVGDGEQVISFMGTELVGVDPADGKVLWRHKHPTKYNINAMTPMVSDDGLIFVSSAYDAGSRVVQPTESGVREVWFGREMKVHHASVVRLGDTVVGSSGDFGPAFLMGVDVHSGEERFKARGFAKANLLKVGEQILLLDEDGTLAIASLVSTPGEEGEPVEQKLEVHTRAQVLSSRSWAVPALVGTTLYLRDQKEMIALALGQ